MATLLFYFLMAFLLPLVVGGLVGMLFYFVFDKLRTDRAKKNYLKKLKGDNEALANPGKETIDAKEVKENEQREFRKFREFEKLRSVAISRKQKQSDRGIAIANRSIPKSEQLPERELLSNDAHHIDPKHLAELGESATATGKNKQSIELPKPDVV